LQLIDLRALRCLDLFGQIVHPWVDSFLGEDNVAHLDRLGVMRNHLLRERHIRLVVCTRVGCRGGGSARGGAGPRCLIVAGVAAGGQRDQCGGRGGTGGEGLLLHDRRIPFSRCARMLIKQDIWAVGRGVHAGNRRRPNRGARNF
jgi:hypothetical protein